MYICQLCQSGTARVSYNKSAPVAASLYETHAYHGVCHSSIGADDEETLAVGQLSKGVGHGTAAEGGSKTCHRGAVSEPCAVIYIIGSQGTACEFLQEVVLFVGAAG